MYYKFVFVLLAFVSVSVSADHESELLWEYDDQYFSELSEACAVWRTDKDECPSSYPIETLTTSERGCLLRCDNESGTNSQQKSTNLYQKTVVIEHDEEEPNECEAGEGEQQTFTGQQEAGSIPPSEFCAAGCLFSGTTQTSSTNDDGTETWTGTYTQTSTECEVGTDGADDTSTGDESETDETDNDETDEPQECTGDYYTDADGNTQCVSGGSDDGGESESETSGDTDTGGESESDTGGDSDTGGESESETGGDSDTGGDSESGTTGGSGSGDSGDGTGDTGGDEGDGEDECDFYVLDGGELVCNDSGDFTEEEPRDGSASDCGSEPSCSGDAIDCAILQQIWSNACDMEIPTEAEVLAATGLEEFSDVQASLYTEVSSDDILAGGQFDDSGFGVAGSCPTMPSFAVWGTTFTPDIEMVCTIVEMIGLLVLIIGALHSATILQSAF